MCYTHRQRFLKDFFEHSGNATTVMQKKLFLSLKKKGVVFVMRSKQKASCHFPSKICLGLGQTCFVSKSLPHLSSFQVTPSRFKGSKLNTAKHLSLEGQPIVLTCKHYPEACKTSLKQTGRGQRSKWKMLMLLIENAYKSPSSSRVIRNKGRTLSSDPLNRLNLLAPAKRLNCNLLGRRSTDLIFSAKHRLRQSKAILSRTGL